MQLALIIFEKDLFISTQIFIYLYILSDANLTQS